LIKFYQRCKLSLANAYKYYKIEWRMIMSNLDTVVNRKGTYSIKWDGVDLDYKNHELVPMWIADMDFKVPESVLEAVTKQAQVGIYGYAMPSECYNSYIVDWFNHEHSWVIKEDEIGYAARVVDALSLAVRALTEEGDSIIMQAPLYHFFEAVVTNAKRKVIKNELENQTGHYTINFEKFEQQIIDENVKMYILCNPHNPTGRVWSETELVKIIDVCKKHKVIIVSDDIHSDLIMPGHSYLPIGKLAENKYNNIVTMKSTSKTFNLAGLQLGYYISGNKNIMEAIDQEKEYCTYIDLPNNFAIAAMIEAYTKGKPWLSEVLNYINENNNRLTKFVEEKLPNAILTPLEATYLAWLDVSYLNITEDELKERLDTAGIGVQTTSDFGISDGLYIRINIACPKETLNLGLAALEKALN
jgi:cystathionine beta-lyase